MFGRIVSMRLKPNTEAEFTQTFEREIVPALRKQQGFRDELLFVVPGGTEAASVSLWDSKESAENYHRATYPNLLNMVTKSIEGTPEVRTFEVASSTFHKIAARVAA